MEPKRFLETAETLTDPDFESEECDWRTAISRAYYAAFLDARKLLSEMEILIKNIDAHEKIQGHLKYVVSKLGGNENRVAVKILTQLRDMHHHRLRADYELTPHKDINLSKAEQRIQDAYTFINFLDHIRDTPDLYKDVKDSLEEYRSGSGKRV